MMIDAWRAPAVLCDEATADLVAGLLWTASTTMLVCLLTWVTTAPPV